MIRFVPATLAAALAGCSSPEPTNVTFQTLEPWPFPEGVDSIIWGPQSEPVVLHWGSGDQTTYDMAAPEYPRPMTVYTPEGNE